MHYCPMCRKLTNDIEQKEFTEDFSSQYFLIYIYCNICGSYKFRYLKKQANYE